jgi:DNA repair protein SbcD/Mre11
LFKFIHAADLHLDSPFKGLSVKEPELVELVRNSTFQAYDNLIDLCIKEQVDFLIIAGDIFDSSIKSIRAQLRFKDGLVLLNDYNIQVYIAFGNHDPFNEWLPSIKWSPNVHIFPTDKTEIFFQKNKSGDVVNIQGMSHMKSGEKRNLSRFFNTQKSHCYEIGILHCNVGGNPDHDPYAPCLLSDLYNSGINYWALGHIHKRSILKEDPYIVYSGNTQGRDINESGGKGCFLVKVKDPSNTTVEFKRLDAITWIPKEIDINGIETLPDLADRLDAEFLKLTEKSDGRPILSRIKLIGRSPLFGELCRLGKLDEFLELLRDKGKKCDPIIWIEKLETDLKPSFDIEDLRNNPDFMGEILRISSDIQNSEDIRKSFEDFLDDIFSYRKMSGYLDKLSDESLLKLLKEAEYLCVDSFLT